MCCIHLILGPAYNQVHFYYAFLKPQTKEWVQFMFLKSAGHITD